MAWTSIPEWPHGRVWKGKGGRSFFYVSRGGKDVATGATTIAGALEALARLEKTGDARLPADRDPVVLDTALATEFLAFLKAKGDSIEWRRNVRQHLAWWEAAHDAKGRPAGNLRGRDLRAGRRGSVTITELRGALDGAPSARQREAVLRALYTYLRGADRIATDEDPTYGKPRIAPPSRPAQEKIDKTIELRDVETIRRHFEADYLRRGCVGRRWADLLSVLDGTGMHVSELRRFAEAGEIEPLPGGRQPTGEEAAVLMVPLHKNGAPHRVAVSAEVADAARRVREAGAFSVSVFYAELRRAAETTGTKVLPGRFRHTVARMAVEAGATVAEVATFLGHKSPATTKRFYATLGVPMKVKTRR